MTKREVITIIFLIIIFVTIRSLHFASSLNFSTDPALFSSAALDIYQTHKLRLIGPTFSLNFNGRYAFQGAVIYYFQLLFLLLGHWDPVASSYIFMLFCAIMLIPLYLGTRMLINKTAALTITIAYSLLPFYINYTKFLWNPNFQLSLLPLLILLMGLYKKNNYNWLLLLTGILSGLILQFHYQIILVIIGLIIFYRKNISPLISGLIIGFSPILLFELRHNFYNLQTLYLFFTHPADMGNSPHSLSDYYFLSLSLLALLILSKYIAVLNKKLLYSLIISLLLIDLFIYIPKPGNGFRMADNWNYPAELKVHQLIMAQKLTDFNVTNLVYDTKADTQKYLLRRDHITINFDDYYHNNYLFLVGTDAYATDPAYEIKSFQPRHLLATWKINSWYNLYLFTRTP